MDTDKTIKSGKHEIIERRIDRHMKQVDPFFLKFDQISNIINEKFLNQASYLPKSFNKLHIDMIVGMETLLFLHLLHKEYKFSYSQIGKMLGLDRATIYRYMNKDQLSNFQDLKVKRAIAGRITKLQDDFINTYKK